MRFGASKVFLPRASPAYNNSVQVFENTPNTVVAGAHILLALRRLLTHEWSCQREPPMPILFNKTIQQCRLLGARGGRAYARNLRLRKMQSPPRAQPTTQPSRSGTKTTHEACLLLDRQFPWLAEAFAPRRPSSVPTQTGYITSISKSPHI